MAETFDIQLIESCKKGNRVAQKVLYDRLASRMFPVCMRYVGDRTLAEDILQDGFITLFTRLNSFKGEGSFEGWARRIFVTTALMHLRKKDALKMSDDLEAAKKLEEKFGAPVMGSYAEAVGKVDGVIVTARHGDNHYKYAAPYIKSGVPMFIDKPITVSEDEAVKFMRECRENGVKITGGSCCKHDIFVKAMKRDREENAFGKTLSGLVRAPISLDNPYGGFFF